MDKELEEWHKLHKFHYYAGAYETKDLAIFLGISTRTIQRWLKEKAKPTKKQVEGIKRYLAENNAKNAL